MIRVLDSAGSTLVEWGRQQQQQHLIHVKCKLKLSRKENIYYVNLRRNVFGRALTPQYVEHAQRKYKKN